MDLFTETRVELSTRILDYHNVAMWTDIGDKCKSLEQDLNTIWPCVFEMSPSGKSLYLSGLWDDIVQIQKAIKEWITESTHRDSNPDGNKTFLEFMKMTQSNTGNRSNVTPENTQTGMTLAVSQLAKSENEFTEEKKLCIERQTKIACNRPKRNIKHKYLPLLKTMASNFYNPGDSHDFHQSDTEEPSVTSASQEHKSAFDVGERIKKEHARSKCNLNEEYTESMTNNVGYVSLSENVCIIHDDQTRSTMNSLTDNFADKNCYICPETPCHGYENSSPKQQFETEQLQTYSSGKCLDSSNMNESQNVSLVDTTTIIPNIGTDIFNRINNHSQYVSYDDSGHEKYDGDGSVNEMIPESMDHDTPGYTIIDQGQVKHENGVTDTAMTPCDRMIKCLKCPYTTQVLNYMKIHVRRSHMIKKFICDQCPKAYGIHKDLLAHKSTHSRPFPCDYCPKRFAKAYLMRQHVQNQHIGTPKKRGPKTHNSCKEVGQNNMKCENCLYVSINPRNLKAHVQRQHGEKTYQCDECDIAYALVKDFNHHKRTIHGGEISCDLCDKTLKHQSLANHKRVVHMGFPSPSKSYQCHICGKMCNGRTEYDTHQNKIHLNIRPYKCEICGMTFHAKANLTRHTIIHTSVKKYECDECGKKFQQPQGLRAHRNIHKQPEDLPHRCSTCNKAFTQRGALIRHMRIHSGQRPYHCKFCKISFNDYSILRRHLVGIHKMNDINLLRHTVQEACEKAKKGVSYETPVRKTFDISKDIAHENNALPEEMKILKKIPTDIQLSKEHNSHKTEPGNVSFTTVLDRVDGQPGEVVIIQTAPLAANQSPEIQLSSVFGNHSSQIQLLENTVQGIGCHVNHRISGQNFEFGKVQHIVPTNTSYSEEAMDSTASEVITFEDAVKEALDETSDQSNCHGGKTSSLNEHVILETNGSSSPPASISQFGMRDSGSLLASADGNKTILAGVPVQACSSVVEVGSSCMNLDHMNQNQLIMESRIHSSGVIPLSICQINDSVNRATISNDFPSNIPVSMLQNFRDTTTGSQIAFLHNDQQTLLKDIHDGNDSDHVIIITNMTDCQQQDFNTMLPSQNKASSGVQ